MATKISRAIRDTRNLRHESSNGNDPQDDIDTAVASSPEFQVMQANGPTQEEAPREEDSPKAVDPEPKAQNDAASEEAPKKEKIINIGKIVKIDSDLASRVKYLAASSNVTSFTLLSEIIGPEVDWAFSEIYASGNAPPANGPARKPRSAQYPKTPVRIESAIAAKARFVSAFTGDTVSEFISRVSRPKIMILWEDARKRFGNPIA